MCLINWLVISKVKLSNLQWDNVDPKMIEALREKRFFMLNILQYLLDPLKLFLQFEAYHLYGK